MEAEPTPQPTVASTWQAKQVYAMAGISLVVGLAIEQWQHGSNC